MIVCMCVWKQGRCTYKVILIFTKYICSMTPGRVVVVTKRRGVECVMCMSDNRDVMTPPALETIVRSGKS